MTITNNTNFWDLPNEMHFQIIESFIGNDLILKDEDIRNLNHLGATCRFFHSITYDFIRHKLQCWINRMKLIAPRICDRIVQTIDKVPHLFHSPKHIVIRNHYNTIMTLSNLYKDFNKLNLGSDTTHSKENVQRHSGEDCICMKLDAVSDEKFFGSLTHLTEENVKRHSDKYCICRTSGVVFDDKLFGWLTHPKET